MTIVLERRGMKMIVRWKLIRANILQLQLSHGPHLTNIILTPYSYNTHILQTKDGGGGGDESDNDYRSIVIDDTSSLWSIDGKSDEYDDKLLDEEKKSTSAANLNDLESHNHQFGCICVPWFSCFVCNSFDWCGGLIYTHENHLRTLLNLGNSILLLNSRLLEITAQI